jgi:hypothetical protein
MCDKTQKKKKRKFVREYSQTQELEGKGKRQDWQKEDLGFSSLKAPAALTGG